MESILQLNKVEQRQLTTPDSPHQQTLINQLQIMVNQQVGSDVTFVVGPKKVLFYAHAFILAVRSITWQQQLYNAVVPVLQSPSKTPSTPSKSKNKKDIPTLPLSTIDQSPSATFTNSAAKFVIELPSADAASFLEFLNYVYCAKCTVNNQNAIHLLYLAKKYQLDDLRLFCVEFVRASVSMESVWDMLEIAALYQEQDLMDICLSLIDEHIVTLLSQPFHLQKWYGLGADAMIMILQRNSLNISEIQLFTFVWQWCLHHSKKDAKEAARKMQPFCSHIRFPLISSDDLVHIVAPTNAVASEPHLHSYVEALEYNVDPLKFASVSHETRFQKRLCKK